MCYEIWLSLNEIIFELKIEINFSSQLLNKENTNSVVVSYNSNNE